MGGPKERKCKSIDECEALVSAEIKDNMGAVHALMERLRADDPRTTRHCQATIVKTKVLYQQHKIIDHMLHEGELLDLDAAPL